MGKGGFQQRRIKEKRRAEKQARRRARRRRVLVGWVAGILALALVGVVAALALGGNDDGSLAADPSPSPSATATGDDECTAWGPQNEGQKSFPSPPCMEIDTAKTYTATIDTSMGAMKIALFPKDAPRTVNNFVFLARAGFYDGVVFHRVIPGFMIQGGDPEGSGRGGPGYAFGDENTVRFEKRGLLAMANSGPGTNGSQFFITVGDIEHLNVQCPGPQGCHSVFGEVVEGYDVAVKISETPRNAEDRPNTEVVIRSITIDEK